MQPSSHLSDLLAIMARLRDPQTGCAWDLKQSFESIAAYTLEEAYEVVDAIERKDWKNLREELGDLLLQVVFHAQIGHEQGLFDFSDVVEAITTKLIRRHPHIFGEQAGTLSADDVKSQWDAIKALEKKERGYEAPSSLLNAVPVALPALSRAHALSKKAASVGFDWPDTAQVMAKVHEELHEVAEALAAKDKDAVEDEIGDALFALANLARHAGIHPESALRRTNAKFKRRFGAIESALSAQGSSLDEASLEEMETLWVRAKEDEQAN